MAGKSKDYSREGCVDYANELVKLCELSIPSISSIQDINSNFFASLFETITDLTVPDLLMGNDSTTETHNIQAFIDTLSLDLLDVSLSHITGEDVMSGNILSIFCLLEILEALFLHLNPHKKKELSKTYDNSSAENISERISSDKIFRKTVSLSSVTTSSVEAIPPIKRKTCKNTLYKSHQKTHIPPMKTSEVPQMKSAKRCTDTVDRGTTPVKRKILRQSSRKVKRPNTETREGLKRVDSSKSQGIEELHDLNFESKVRALMQSDKSPTVRAKQLKNKYIERLCTPLKKKPIPPCKKSFLLPHNLRHKRKSSTLQSPTRKRTSQRIKSAKKTVSEETVKHEKNCDAPAVIQSVLEEFPGFQFPKNIQDLLTKQYHQHVGLMHKQLRETLLKKPTTLIQTEKAMVHEAKLSKILTKDLKERKYLRESNEHKNVVNKIKYGFRDSNLQSAKFRQYFNEFHESMRRKMQKRNYSEEVLIEKTFKAILDHQRKKVRELCQRVIETDKQDARQHRQYLNALKNLYQQQLCMLEESINTKHKDSTARAKAQKLTTQKVNLEIRNQLLKEVHSLQKDVLEMMEDIHFREMDAQNFIRSFQDQDS